MPPFDQNWFRVISDQANPIGMLRLAWIMLNTAEDKRLAQEERKSEIEYFGLFANPQAYFKIVHGRDAEENTSMQIVKVNNDYQRLFHLALADKPEIHPQRVDIAERVREKRKQLATAKQIQDPRIHTYPAQEYDDLVIERDPRK